MDIQPKLQARLHVDRYGSEGAEPDHFGFAFKGLDDAQAILDRERRSHLGHPDRQRTGWLEWCGMLKLHCLTADGPEPFGMKVKLCGCQVDFDLDNSSRACEIDAQPYWCATASDGWYTQNGPDNTLAALSDSDDPWSFVCDEFCDGGLLAWVDLETGALTLQKLEVGIHRLVDALPA